MKARSTLIALAAIAALTPAFAQDEGSVQNLKLNEFFLMLSTVGNAHRKCELVYVKGDEIGVRFLQKAEGKRRPRPMFSENEEFVP